MTRRFALALLALLAFWLAPPAWAPRARASNADLPRTPVIRRSIPYIASVLMAALTVNLTATTNQANDGIAGLPKGAALHSLVVVPLDDHASGNGNGDGRERVDEDGHDFAGGIARLGLGSGGTDFDGGIARFGLGLREPGGL